MVPPKPKLVDLIQAQSESLEDFSKRFVKIETQIEKQENKNENIIQVVIIGAVFVFITVAAEVVISNVLDKQFIIDLQNKVQESDLRNIESNKSLEIENVKLKEEISSLKKDNPYLK